MIRKTFFYYFSPTGGTKRIGETFAKAAAENVVYENLGDRSWKEEGEGDGEDVLAVVALPVYGGRIPELAAEKLRMVTGRGRKGISCDRFRSLYRAAFYCKYSRKRTAGCQGYGRDSKVCRKSSA